MDLGGPYREIWDCKTRTAMGIAFAVWIIELGYVIYVVACT